MRGGNNGHSSGMHPGDERVAANPSHGILATLPIALALWLVIILTGVELIKWLRP
ncbi:MAG: hypothetical protein WC804_14720 [Sphingomonas sp.]|jgi:hypothetical protein|uniref:hypothetical protein n=1 Tax=Sphingomonas sp. TaxID=28214 RepID=UPI0035668406